MYDASQPSVPVYNLSTNPLAIASLSVSGDGRFALGASLDGMVVMVDVKEGRSVGRVESAREKVGGGSGEFGFCIGGEAGGRKASEVRASLRESRVVS